MTELLELIAHLAPLLSEETMASITALAKAREWGVALENLCQQLYELEVAVVDQTLERIAELGRRMGLNEANWNDLKGIR